MTGYRILDDHATRRAGATDQDPFVLVSCGCGQTQRIRASAFEQVAATSKVGMLCARCTAVHAIPRTELERAFLRLRR